MKVREGLRRSLATPDPFVLTNKICLNQFLQDNGNTLLKHEGKINQFLQDNGNTLLEHEGKINQFLQDNGKTLLSLV